MRKNAEPEVEFENLSPQYSFLDMGSLEPWEDAKTKGLSLHGIYHRRGEQGTGGLGGHRDCFVLQESPHELVSLFATPHKHTKRINSPSAQFRVYSGLPTNHGWPGCPAKSTAHAAHQSDRALSY